MTGQAAGTTRGAGPEVVLSSSAADETTTSASGRGTPGRRSLAAANRRFGAGLVSPAALVLIVLLALPGLLTVDYSLHRVPPSGNGTGAWVGLDNYGTVFGSPVFWRSVRTTVYFAVGFVVLSTVIGLATALLLNQRFRGRGMARALLVLPWACPWLVIGILWKWFADGSVGGLNGLLMRLHLISEYKDFLSDPNWALVIAVIAATWRQSCFAGLLFLAGLQTLPGELVEAASVDGAGIWKRFRNVTVPWLRPVLVTVTVLNLIYAFLQFDVVYALTQGGPGDATQMLSLLIYRQLFVFTDIGTGSALAVVLGLFALVAGLATVRVLYRRSET